MDLSEASMIIHIGIVLAALWFASLAGFSHSILFFLAFLYLFLVNERCSLRLRRRIQHEERKSAQQRRILSDVESVRWLNYTVQKMWPICMEPLVSQQFLAPVIPWFLDKFKPRALVNKATVQSLYLGRSAPMFTYFRVVTDSCDDDHLVLELGLSFLTAEDMDAVLAIQLQKAVGFGMTTNMHLTSMHVEGKILVGIKFVRGWPFLGRIRLCFVEPPYFQMSVKPLVNQGVDVTELPGVSTWLDSLLDTAFHKTLVEPNMFVIDVQKFTSAPKENDWFKIDEKPPIAYVKLEIIEGADMKPSDMNGLADPYIKGSLGVHSFHTQIQWKTLNPKWQEEFRIPITSWETPHELILNVLDKDLVGHDALGDCRLRINELKGGLRHDKWISLEHIKKGRIHIAITIEEATETQKDLTLKDEPSSATQSTDIVSGSNSIAGKDSPTDKSGHPVLKDELEPIKLEGLDKTIAFVHRPGTGASPTWEPRKGRQWNPDHEIQHNDSSIHGKSLANASGNNSSNGKSLAKPLSVKDSKKGS